MTIDSATCRTVHATDSPLLYSPPDHGYLYVPLTVRSGDLPGDVVIYLVSW